VKYTTDSNSSPSQSESYKGLGMSVFVPGDLNLPTATPNTTAIIYHQWAKGSQESEAMEECHQAGAKWIELSHVENQYKDLVKLFKKTFWIHDGLRKHFEEKESSN